MTHIIIECAAFLIVFAFAFWLGARFGWHIGVRHAIAELEKAREAERAGKQ